MKNILVPVDFSDCSVNALNYAILFSKFTGSKIFLLHVYAVPVTATDIPYADISFVELEKQHTIRLNEMVAEQKKINNSEAVASIASRMGNTTDEIKSFAVESKIDLIIMGTRDKTTLGDKFFGSTATGMIKKSPCPLLLVREGEKFIQPKNIALACDLKHLKDTQRLRIIKEFAKTFSSKILVFSVINETEEYEPVKAVATDVLEDFLRGYDHSIYFPVSNNINEGILNFVSEHKSELLVMFHHIHNVYEKIFEPLHSKEISFNVKVPLLVINEHIADFAPAL